MEESLPFMIPIVATVLGISLGFFGVWTQHKQKIAKLEIEARAQAQAAEAGEAGHNARRIAELEDRLRVVERIVTDRGFDVAHQIEALRDAPRSLDVRARQEAE